MYNLKLTLCSNLVRGVISLHVACRPTTVCDVLSQSCVCSTANFLREIPYILSCFHRVTRHTRLRGLHQTKYELLMDKPQNEFSSYFCEAKHIILLPGHSFFLSFFLSVQSAALRVCAIIDRVERSTILV